MKYKKKITKQVETIEDTNDRITVYDKDGNGYDIWMNHLGYIAISSNNGALIVDENYYNEIQIKTE